VQQSVATAYGEPKKLARASSKSFMGLKLIS
jgi:hypothetical protein